MLFVWIAGALLVLVVMGVAVQSAGSARDRRRYPPPGQMVSLGTHRLHSYCVSPDRQDRTLPTVVFEAALGGSSLSWSWVQREVGKFAHALTYDRAGMGWSDEGPAPRTLSRIVDELYQLLQTANVRPPYILVGHSYGGLVVQLFAARHPDEVCGLVLVDAPSPTEWAKPSKENRARLTTGVRLARHGAVFATLGIARLVGFLIVSGALSAAKGFVTVCSGGTLRKRTASIVGPALKLPDELQPVMRAFWMQPRFYRTLASQLKALQEGAATVCTCGPLGSLPLVVLTAHDATPQRIAEQEECCRQSKHGRQIVAASSGHWIPLEEPKLVVSAIQDVIAAMSAKV